MIRPSALVGSACAVVLLFAAVPEATSEEKPKGDKMWVFVGTRTGGQSKGIYRCEFDTTTGNLGTPELAAETKGPPSSGDEKVSGTFSARGKGS